MHNTVQLFGPQLKKPEFKATATEVYIRERVNMDKEPDCIFGPLPTYFLVDYKVHGSHNESKTPIPLVYKLQRLCLT